MATNWKVYGLTTPWNYVNNDVENHFNITGRLTKVNGYYKVQYPVHEWTELKAALKMNGIESGLATITSYNEAAQLFTGIVLHDTIRDFRYFYFINDTQRLGNGGVEYALQLNYFATFGEKALYALHRENTNTSILDGNIQLDRYTLFNEFVLTGNTNNAGNFKYVDDVFNYQLFQSTLQRLPDDINFSTSYNLTPHNNIFKLSTTFGGYQSLREWGGDSPAYAIEMRNNYPGPNHINPNLRLSRKLPNGNYEGIEDKYKLFWTQGARDRIIQFFDSQSGASGDKMARTMGQIAASLSQFNSALNTDKFVLMQLRQELYIPQQSSIAAGSWNQASNWYGKGDRSVTMTIALPIPQGVSGNWYEDFAQIFGSGALPVESKIVGIIRLKTSMFYQSNNAINSLVVLDSNSVGFTGLGWSQYRFFFGFVLNGNVVGVSGSRYVELGWTPQTYLPISVMPWTALSILNNPHVYHRTDRINDLLLALFGFNGANQYYVQNDLEVFAFDPSRFRSPIGFYLTYHPMGEESLWLNVHARYSGDHVGTNPPVVPDFYYNNAILASTENLTKLGAQSTKISAITPPSPNQAQFWATQKNAWETGNEQTLFNSVNSFVSSGASVLGGVAGGALVGSIVPGIGTAIGAAVGGVAAGFSQIGAIGNSIYAMKERKAKEKDLASLTGGTMMQGVLQWVRSSYINVIEAQISEPTRVKLYNWLAINGFNTARPGDYRQTSPENARPLVNWTRNGNGPYQYSYSPLKYLTLRVHADSSQNLIQNINSRFKRLNMVIPNIYLSWLVNLMTTGVRLTFNTRDFNPNNSREVELLNDIDREIASELEVTKQLQAQAQAYVDDISAPDWSLIETNETFNQNRTGDTSAVEKQPEDDAQPSQIPSNQDRERAE